MTVMIIGESCVNGRVCEYFTQQGMKVSHIPDVNRLRSITGEIGNFRVDTKENEGIEDVHYTEIDFIVLTEQPSAEHVEIVGLMTRSLYEDGKVSTALKTAVSEPVVFLLDFVKESPLSATMHALKDAAELARNKRQVFYLAKFIRTAGRGIETLYNEARNAGVTFVKYENIDIRTDLSEDEFSISVSDGVQELEIKTKTLYADGGPDVGERFEYATKKLNLTTNDYGNVTEDKFYLAPALTSRRGVYHITRDLAAERLDEGLDYIYAHAKSRFRDIPSLGVATIDGKKCVFCYNCYRACSHAALEPDSKNSQMQSLTEACAGCGTCAGLCPANAITMADEEVCDDAGAALGKALVICCENSGGATLEESNSFDVITVPCGGLIDTGRLSDELYAYDKVLAVICPDDACRHFDGNKRACAQVSRLRDMLSAAKLDTERVRIIQASQAMPGVLREELDEFLGG